MQPAVPNIMLTNMRKLEKGGSELEMGSEVLTMSNIAQDEGVLVSTAPSQTFPSYLGLRQDKDRETRIERPDSRVTQNSSIVRLHLDGEMQKSCNLDHPLTASRQKPIPRI